MIESDLEKLCSRQRKLNKDAKQYYELFVKDKLNNCKDSNDVYDLRSSLAFDFGEEGAEEDLPPTVRDPILKKWNKFVKEEGCPYS